MCCRFCILPISRVAKTDDIIPRQKELTAVIQRIKFFPLLQRYAWTYADMILILKSSLCSLEGNWNSERKSICELLTGAVIPKRLQVTPLSGIVYQRCIHVTIHMSQ